MYIGIANTSILSLQQSISYIQSSHHIYTVLTIYPYIHTHHPPPHLLYTTTLPSLTILHTLHIYTYPTLSTGQIYPSGTCPDLSPPVCPWPRPQRRSGQRGGPGRRPAPTRLCLYTHMIYMYKLHIRICIRKDKVCIKYFHSQLPHNYTTTMHTTYT